MSDSSVVNHEYIAIVDARKGPDVLSVSWDTSGICNYKCTYCDPHYHDGKNKFPPLDNIIGFLLDLQSRSNKAIYLEIKGGEPTYWKDLPAFLNLAWQNHWGTCLVTNGSRDLTWWKDNLEKIADVNLSIHPESFQLDHITEVIRYIRPRRSLYVKYLMFPPYFDECVRNIEALRLQFPNLNISAIPVAKPDTGNDLYNYTEIQIEKMKSLNSYKRKSTRLEWPRFPFDDRVKAFKLYPSSDLKEFDKQNIKLERDNSWMGWLCNAGIDRIHIGVSGDIFRGQCKQGGRIGNIHEKWWEIPRQPVICKKRNCFCGSELLLKKWNPEKVSLLNSAFVPL